MLPNVVRAYAEEGHLLRLGSPRMLVSGVQPLDEPRYIANGAPLPPTDWGFTVRDFYVFELIARCFAPKTGFVIGNAFGISAVSLGALFDPIRLDVIDAELCGEASVHGADLTRRVARRLGLDLQLTRGFSPRDIPEASRSATYDLVFIDGDHQNHQMIADFDGLSERLSDRCAVVFHDVALWNMDEAWAHVRSTAAPLGLKAYDLSFTDFGSTVLLRDLPELEAMFELTCPGLRARNERYHAGVGFMPPETTAPEHDVLFLGPGERVAFYGSGYDFQPYRPFVQAHPETVVAIFDDDASKWGTRIDGIEVADPNRLTEFAPDAVIVSTKTFELDVRIRLAKLAPDLPVHPGRGEYPAPGLNGPVEIVLAPTKVTSSKRTGAARPRPAAVGSA